MAAESGKVTTMEYGYYKEFGFRQARAAEKAERQQRFAEARRGKRYRGERRRRARQWRRGRWLREQLA